MKLNKTHFAIATGILIASALFLFDGSSSVKLELKDKTADEVGDDIAQMAQDGVANKVSKVKEQAAMVDAVVNDGKLVVVYSNGISTEKRDEILSKFEEAGYGSVIKEGKLLASRLEQAASKGYPLAATAVGLMYYQGRGITKNTREAARWFLIAAQGGEPTGIYYYGLMNMRAQGGLRRNPGVATDMYYKAALKGHPEAIVDLGGMYAEEKQFDNACAFWLVGKNIGAPHAKVNYDRYISKAIDKAGVEKMANQIQSAL